MRWTIPFCIMAVLTCGGARPTRLDTHSTPWQTNVKNPVISHSQGIPRMIWNDPSVMKEDDTFRMWLSGGTGIGINHVRIYQATSKDGVTWQIDPAVLLGPSDQDGLWDNNAIETPSVIKVNGTYHMYYSGKGNDDPGGVYQIGHATSPDGTTWTKDPDNPVIQLHGDANHWGFYHVAEPGAVYDSKNDIIYLYYMTSKLRPGYSGKNSNLLSMHGVCLATSPGNDGSTFTHYDPDKDGFADAVLLQSPNYPPEKDYRGYSTPFALIDSDGLFHLYYDVVVHPKRGEWEQVALAHAASSNGTSFAEIEYDILIRGSEKWTGSEIRAPSVLVEGDTVRMWYAGQTSWFKDSGIGTATYHLNH